MPPYGKVEDTEGDRHSNLWKTLGFLLILSALKQMAVDCTKHSTMKEATVLAVQLGARTWFETSLASAIEGSQSNEEKLRSLIKFVQLLQADLLRAKTYYDGVFKRLVTIAIAIILSFNQTNDFYATFAA